jgi:uncharacterized membrane protein
MVQKFSLLLAVAAALVIPNVAMAAHAGGAHGGARAGGVHVMGAQGRHYAYGGGGYRVHRGYGYGGPGYGYGGCIGLPVPVIGCY